MKKYHKNPRKIEEQKFEDLRRWLDEFGDLSGIVHDLNSDEIISGNQRSAVFNINDCEVVLLKQLDKPDKQGTVAHGYVAWNGAQYNYRQVRWTPEQCERANVIANKAGGDWDLDILLRDFELPVLAESGFNQGQLDDLVQRERPNEVSEKQAPEDFAEYNEDIDTQYCCPKCGYEWSGKPK